MLNVERKERIAVYTINRPQALNAVCKELAERLVNEMEASEKDGKTRVHWIRSEGKHFSAGADIKEMVDQKSWTIGSALRLDVWKRLRTLFNPVVCSVQGFALGGGCELALSADFIYAAEDAQFGQPEINLGLMPGAGGTVRWVKLVGRVRAAEILLLGDKISAHQAIQWGLINKTFPTERLLPETEQLCQRLSNLSSPALRSIKLLMNKNLETPELQAMDQERDMFYSLFGSPDQIEGVNAFIEKRKPKFS